MPDYTPEVHRMRDAAANSDWTDTGYVNPETIKAGYDAFDRMIATVRREAVAEALTEFADDVASLEFAFVTSDHGTLVRKLDVMDLARTRAAEMRDMKETK